jgi:uncharacterized protein YjbI with pentapeptide repeats
VAIDALEHDDVHAEVELSDVALSRQSANGVALRQTRLTRVALTESRLDQLELADAALVSCDLSNVQGQGVQAERVTLESTGATGLGFPEARLCDLDFRECRLDLTSFAFSRFARVKFEGCLMTEASFLDAQLEAVRFDGCDLGRADFRGARLRRCEFRRTNLAEIEGVDRLSGAAIDSPGIVAMADVWAAALGISVLDAD